MNDNRAPDHPQDHVLAAFLDGELTESEHADVQEHLNRCEHCRATVSVAAGTLMDAPRPRRLARWLAPVAAVAAVAVGVFVLQETPVPVERSDAPVDLPTVGVIAPADGMVSAGTPSMFIWKGVESGATYELTLTDASGEPVWSTQTTDTVAALPDDLELTDGQYFWMVDALLARGREASTGVLGFRIAR